MVLCLCGFVGFFSGSYVATLWCLKWCIFKSSFHAFNSMLVVILMSDISFINSQQQIELHKFMSRRNEVRRTKPGYLKHGCVAVWIVREQKYI